MNTNIEFFLHFTNTASENSVRHGILNIAKVYAFSTTSSRDSHSVEPRGWNSRVLWTQSSWLRGYSATSSFFSPDRAGGGLDRVSYPGRGHKIPTTKLVPDWSENGISAKFIHWCEYIDILSSTRTFVSLIFFRFHDWVNFLPVYLVLQNFSDEVFTVFFDENNWKVN